MRRGQVGRAVREPRGGDESREAEAAGHARVADEAERDGSGPGTRHAGRVGGAARAGRDSAAAAEQGASPAGEVPLIYRKQRSFRIPFNLSAAQKSRIKEVILLVSEDSGYTWEPESRTDAEHPAFSFRASHDGEYWFTVQTRTVDGKVSPGLDATVEPKMKVVIDTVPPSLVLEPDRRRGSAASVRWEVKDEYLDLRSMVLEYQVEGVGVWNRVPIARPKLIGSQAWDAGTAEALRVRMSVADEAGNVTDGGAQPARRDGQPAGGRLEPGRGRGPAEHRADLGHGPGPAPDHGGPGLHPGGRGAAAEPAGRRRRRRPGPGRAPRPAAKARPRPTPPAWDRDPGPPPPAGPSTLAASASGSPRVGLERAELFRHGQSGPAPDGGSGAVPAGAAAGAVAAGDGSRVRGRPAAAAILAGRRIRRTPCWSTARGSSSSTRWTTPAPTAPPRSSSGSPRTAAAPGSAAATTRTAPRPSTWTWAAKGPMGSAWWRGRRRGSAISPRRRAIRPRAGSRWTPPRRPCNWTRCRWAPG